MSIDPWKGWANTDFEHGAEPPPGMRHPAGGELKMHYDAARRAHPDSERGHNVEARQWYHRKVSAEFLRRLAAAGIFVEGA